MRKGTENNMTHTEQERLFQKIRKRFPRRSAEWCSGYLHGITDESELGRPVPDLHYRAKALIDPAGNTYACGYSMGFIDSYGSDADNSWGNGLITSGYWRWWLD